MSLNNHQFGKSGSGRSVAVVPLTMQAYVRLQAGSVPNLAAMAGLTVSEHEELAAEVGGHFEELCAAEPTARIYSQLYDQILSPLVAYRRAIEKTVSSTSKQVIFVPEPEGGCETEKVGEHEIRARALHHILAGVETRPILTGEKLYPRKVRPTMTTRLLEANVKGVVRVRHRLQGIMSRIREGIRRARNCPRILVIGDEGKMWLIQRYGLPGVACTFKTTEALYYLVDGQFKSLDNYGGSYFRDAAEITGSFISGLVSAHADEMEKGASKLCEAFDGVLTCDEHDPLVRLVMEAFVKGQKPVWLFSEGALTLDELSFLHHQRFFYRLPGTARLTLDERELALWMRHGESPEATLALGYLGNSTAHSLVEDLLVRIWWFVHKHTAQKYSHKLPVFLSFDVLEDNGLTRLGLPSETEMLIAMDEAVKALTDANRYIIVKTRTSLMSDIARERYQGMPVVVTSDVGWQGLARLAGHVIARESSIIQEALALGLPAVVWNPTELPSRAEGATNVDPQNVYLARTGKELQQAVDRFSGPKWNRRTQHVAKRKLVKAMHGWSQYAGWSV